MVVVVKQQSIYQLNINPNEKRKKGKEIYYYIFSTAETVQSTDLPGIAGMIYSYDPQQ